MFYKWDEIMNKKIYFYFLSFFISTTLLLISCNEGLSPLNKDNIAYIKWNITYEGGVQSWNDSVYKQIRAIAFRYIPDSTTNLITEITTNAFFSQDSLPQNVSETTYLMEINQTPVELQYLAVVKQFGNNMLTDWRVIGIYSKDAEQKIPESVIVTKGDTFSIDIKVNLHKLPPQPFN